MTVLTMPSTKSDKVPLVDAEQQRDANARPSPPPYHPKLLESGEATETTTDPADRRFKCWTVKAVSVLLLFALIIVFGAGLLCRAINRDVTANKFRADSRGYSPGMAETATDDDNDSDTDDDNINNNNNNNNNDDDDAASIVAYRQYSGKFPSYSAADSDALSAAAAHDHMEDVYKKLEGLALNKGMVHGDVISILNEVLEIDNASPATVTKSARFIHDFSINVTGIVDVDGQRCFVMPLMRNTMAPPVSLFDLLFKMSNDYYSTHINQVLQNMRVVKPALSDLSDYGLYISIDCADYATFKLEKVEASSTTNAAITTTAAAATVADI